MKKTYFLLTFFLAWTIPTFCLKAEEGSLVGERQAGLRPLTVHYTTLGGLQYSLEDVFLTDHKQFRELFDPLGDHEISRMLDRSESSDMWAKVFSTLGFLGLATGAVGLLTTPSNEHGGFLATAAGGSLVFNIGGLFRTEAQTAKFNGVQRYNRFARGEEQKLPNPPADEKALLDFTPTPSPAAQK